MIFSQNDSWKSLLKYISFLIIWLMVFSRTHADFFVQDELTKIFNVSHGEIINSSITLFNPTERAVSIRIYQGDYIQNDDGELLSVRAGSFYRSNANWIRFQSNLILQPQQAISLPFTISIPNSSDLYGSYWSDLFVEEITEMYFTDPEIIGINIRTAVQIVSNIINTGRIDMTFGDIIFNEDTVSLALMNTGNQWVQSLIKIDVFNDRAEFVSSFVSEGNRLNPGFTRRIYIPVMLSKNTNYHAIIVADCGNGNIFGHQVSFIIE